MSNNHEITLVCGGGGVWGVAWMTGVLAGLAAEGVRLGDVSSYVGTSAGSVMSTQLACGRLPAELYQRQIDPAKQPKERAPTGEGMAPLVKVMQASWASERDKLQAICDLAAGAQTISAAERRLDIVERLGLPGDTEWPSRRLQITAVDTETLDLVAFEASSGVALVDAIAASCSVPGVWPRAPINGKFYVDGGVWRTAENAHLAAGSRTVLILSPLGQFRTSPLGSSSGLDGDMAALRASGAEVMLVTADDASMRTIMPGLMDPVVRKPAAEAGREQGLREASKVMELFDRL